MDVQLSPKQKTRGAQLTILVGGIAVIQYAATAGNVSQITLSPPSEMVVNLVDLLESGELNDDFYTTFYEVFMSFIPAVILGTPLGWVLGRNYTLKQIFDPYLILVYALPVFAFYPLLIAIFGINKTPIVIIAFIMSFLVIVINAANGFNSIPETYLELSRSLSLTRWQTIRHIHFRSAVPSLFTGYRLGFIFAFILSLASEFILASAGLGHLVSYYYDTFRTLDMYSVMLLIIVIAVIVNYVLTNLQNRMQARY